MSNATTVNARRSWSRLAVWACLWLPLLAIAAVPAALSAEDGDRELVPQFDPPPVPERLHFPTLVIRRDPFAANIASVSDGVTSADAGGDPSDLVLPPNAAVASPVLRAVILGPSPKALVEVAGRAIVAGIGTPLGNSTVVAITGNSVVLQDGQSLRLAEKHP